MSLGGCWLFFGGWRRRSSGVTLAFMSKSRSEVLSESKRKGVVAGVATAGAVALGVVVASPVLGVVAAVPAAVLTWRWWKHRAENGIKF